MFAAPNSNHPDTRKYSNTQRNFLLYSADHNQQQLHSEGAHRIAGCTWRVGRGATHASPGCNQGEGCPRGRRCLGQGAAWASRVLWEGGGALLGDKREHDIRVGTDPASGHERGRHCGTQYFERHEGPAPAAHRYLLRSGQGSRQSSSAQPAAAVRQRAHHRASGVHPSQCSPVPR